MNLFREVIELKSERKKKKKKLWLSVQIVFRVQTVHAVIVTQEFSWDQWWFSYSIPLLVVVSRDTVGLWEVIHPASLTGTLCYLRQLQDVNVWDGFPLFQNPPEKMANKPPPPQNHVLYCNGVISFFRKFFVIFVALLPQGVDKFNHLIILGRNVFLFWICL